MNRNAKQAEKRMTALAAKVLALMIVTSPALAYDFEPSDYSAMTFHPGRFADAPPCIAACAQFIVAQGQIQPNSHLLMAAMLLRGGKPPLPVIIHSPGGSSVGGTNMARVLRHLGVTVIVARGLPMACPAPGSCPPATLDKPRSFTLTSEAACASACAFVLVGGVRRIVPEGSAVGVHRTSIEGKDEPNKADDPAVSMALAMTSHWQQAFLREMGIAEGLFDIMQATPARDMHYLSLDEMRRFGFFQRPEDGGSPVPSAVIPEASQK
jgi:hypothetical protein